MLPYVAATIKGVLWSLTMALEPFWRPYQRPGSSTQEGSLSMDSRTPSTSLLAASSRRLAKVSSVSTLKWFISVLVVVSSGDEIWFNWSDPQHIVPSVESDSAESNKQIINPDRKKQKKNQI